MADGVVVKTNIPEFKSELAALGQRFEKNLATRASRAAGIVFRAGARRRAPVLKEPNPRRVAGTLQRAIYIGRLSESRRGKVVFRVGVRATKGQTKRGLDPFYWRFLEGGWIPRGRGRGFSGGSRSRALQRDRALKAGSTRVSYPFLKPTFDADKGKALDAFVKTMQDGITAENRRRA